jgi:hypothetical protein
VGLAPRPDIAKCQRSDISLYREYSRRPRILVATADLDPWMWARRLREFASLSLHLELTSPLNPPTLTRRAPELEYNDLRRPLPNSTAMDGVSFFINQLFPVLLQRNAVTFYMVEIIANVLLHQSHLEKSQE